MRLEEVNMNLVKVAEHLMEGARYLSNIPEYTEEAIKLGEQALGILDILEIPEPKITEERVQNVLDEIMGVQEDV